jgi:enoyl-CoA hydratase/carnithine racemase
VSASSWRVSRDGPVTRFALASPDGRQTLSPGILEDLQRGVARAESEGASVAVVESARPGLFAAGADLGAIRELTPAQGYVYARRGQEALLSLSRSVCVVVVEIDGACYGGALDLAMACRVRIATARATFCHPGPRIGIVTGWGGTLFVRRSTRVGVARRVFREGEVFSAETARELGLVDEVVAEGSWRNRRREIEAALVQAHRLLSFG